MGGQAASVQGQLNFSRDMEREADRIGFAVLGLAGYDPAGMAGMFGKLDLANRLNDNGSYPTCAATRSRWSGKARRGCAPRASVPQRRPRHPGCTR